MVKTCRGEPSTLTIGMLEFCDSVSAKGNEFLGVENRKARDPNVKLWRELKLDVNWMSAETSWVRDVARDQRDMVATSVQGFEGGVI